MSDASTVDEESPKKARKAPILLALVLALLGGGGGFYATWSGMILASDDTAATTKKDTAKTPSPDIAYVAVDPLVISLPGSAATRHLKFRAHLEVPAEAEAEVGKVLPRVIDVLNSYLRALEPGDLEDPSGLARLRSQMLRRVQVVTGAEKVNDLLIMEFVLT